MAYVDHELVKHARSITTNAAADGHELEVQAIQKLKKTSLKKLKYFHRDTCHVINSVAKATIRFLKHRDLALIELLVSGPSSFCKRVQYSTAFAKKWRDQQNGCIEDFYTLCGNLSFNDTRYACRTDPMTKFLAKWPVCLSLLVQISNDPDVATWEVRWANVLISSSAGVGGFHRLVSFAVEADFFVVLTECIVWHDKSGEKSDFSMSGDKLHLALRRAHAMFKEGAIFDSEPNNSFTWQLLNSIKKNIRVFFDQSTHIAYYGWQDLDPKEFERPLRFAVSLYESLESFFNL